MADLDRTVQSKLKTTFQMLELAFPSPQVATFGRSRMMKGGLGMGVATVSLLLVGCPLFLMYSGMFKQPGAREFLFIIPFELIGLSMVCLAVLLPRLMHPLVFDKNQQRMWRQRKTDPIFGDYAPLKDIAAVQVCSCTAAGLEARSDHLYELNIVMHRPPEARIAATCHGNRDALFSDAAKLAEFLGVPLLDHTAGE